MQNSHRYSGTLLLNKSFYLLAFILCTALSCSCSKKTEELSDTSIAKELDPGRVEIRSTAVLLDGKEVGSITSERKIPNLPKKLPDGTSGYTAIALDPHTLWLTGGFVESPGSIDKTSKSTYFYQASNSKIEPGPSLNCSRAMHSILRLENGDLLIIGGIEDPEQGKYCRTVELFNPKAKEIEVVGNLRIGRISHSTVSINHTKILVAGGQVEPAEQETETASIEILDLNSKKSRIIGALCYSRQGASLIRLQPGQVLVVGGWNSQSEKNSSSLPTEIISIPKTSL